MLTVYVFIALESNHFYRFNVINSVINVYNSQIQPVFWFKGDYPQ